MKITLKLPRLALLLAAQLLLGLSAVAQDSIPAVTEVDIETLYTANLESRVADIVKALNLTNAVAATQVHDLLVAQYRVMRARDALIDAQLKAQDKDINYANRGEKLRAESKILHDAFFARLSALLTPEQIETVKDKMTYNKVKVTFDAYCQIIGKLTDEEKAKILEFLKAAREEAVDGGSAPEKSAIFQKYKDQINAYLTANGHDVAQAFKDWTEKHPGTNSPVAK